MVVDTSVFIAVLKAESDAEDLEKILARTARLAVSAANHVETVMVLAGKEANPNLEKFDLFLEQMDIEIEPVTRELAVLARQAFLRYGKGRHPARLNYGDCFSYALAVERNEPLLFKGEDFVLTDVLKVR